MKHKNKRSIAVILGTRPEIIKMSPVVRLLEKHKEEQPYFLIHTGQHYSYNMDEQFFQDLRLPKPHFKFTRPTLIGPNSHAELVKWMKESVREVLQTEKPGAVLVQGDTDTVLAGAIAATEVSDITIGHVEAGLRSYDMNMPEERNRIETDKLSHILFAPTESAKKNLIKEKFDDKHIEVTGNTIVDALLEGLEIARDKAGKDVPKGYALLTMHRPESVDNQERLTHVMEAVERLAQKRSLKIVFPVHPRTRQRIQEHGISLHGQWLSVVEPMGFLDFIWHEKNADIILTDSGGVQEEACILKVPCVTIRTTTERPETVEAGGNVVGGYDPDKIVALALKMLAKPKDWKNPFGDGHAAEKILKTTLELKK